MVLFDYLRNEIVNNLLRGTSFTWPSTLAFAAVTSAPTVGQTGATISEVANSNGYARATLNPSTSNYASASGGASSNSAAITFPTATGSWGTIVGVVALDSSTYGAGNCLAYFPLATSKSPTSGDTPSISSGNLTFSLS